MESDGIIPEELWSRGDLSYLLRPHGQSVVYGEVHKWKSENQNRVGPIVLNCHRAFGKSYLLVLLAIERCLRYPNQEVRIAAPTFKQTQGIVAPIIGKILASCPEKLKPEKRQAQVTFHNPRWKKSEVSNLYLISCKDDADAQRGLRSDFIAIDECRDVPNFSYVVNDVFLFHFAQRKNPLLLLSSTPPASVDHAWARVYAAKAQRDGRYFEFNVEDNFDWTEADDKMLVEVCEGKDTSAWRREALCQMIGDESRLIVPEFQRMESEIVVEEYKRPSHFFPYVCIDTGYIDKTAVLFGYVDFLEQTLVVENETLLNRTTTTELAREIYAKEQIFKDSYWPIRRVGDMTPQQLADLVEAMREIVPRNYPVSWSIVDKYHSEAAIAKMRAGIQAKKIKILSRCKSLIDQLRTGIQREQGSKIVFERSEVHGHYDAIAALKYLYRTVKWGVNPFPDQAIPGSMFINPYVEKRTTNRANITKIPVLVTHRRLK